LNDLVVDQSQVDSLRAYSRRLGIPVSDMLREALGDYLGIVCPARLDAISQLEKPHNVIPFQIRKAG
jgi:Ribbon-helix-helix domain